MVSAGVPWFSSVVPYKQQITRIVSGQLAKLLHAGNRRCTAGYLAKMVHPVNAYERQVNQMPSCVIPIKSGSFYVANGYCFWTLADAIKYCRKLVQTRPNDFDYIHGQFVDVNAMLKDGLTVGK